jgi:hypothetical protein
MVTVGKYARIFKITEEIMEENIFLFRMMEIVSKLGFKAQWNGKPS